MFHDNCTFSLWSPNGDGIEDAAFSMYAQACEGDFTVGRSTLNDFCEVLASNYLDGSMSIDEINDINTHYQVANMLGFNFDSLLDEEVDYCIQTLEGMIMNG